MVEVFGDDFDSVCFDIIFLCCGDFCYIVCEVCWEFDVCGYEDVGIFVSGGFGLVEFWYFCDVVEGFGVGGYILNVDLVDFVFDIVEVNGEFVVKWGKFLGVKEVYCMVDGGYYVGFCGWFGLIDGELFFELFICDGEVVFEFDFDIDVVVMWVSEDVELVGFGGVSEE